MTALSPKDPHSSGVVHKRCIFLRGLPGCGKSSYIKRRFGTQAVPEHQAAPVIDRVTICSMDYFFLVGADERYVFDGTKIGVAVSWCHRQVLAAMIRNVETVIIDNTHSRHWEMELCRDMAEYFRYSVEVVDLFDGGCTDEELAARNVHEVPLEIIQGMRARWEP